MATECGVACAGARFQLHRHGYGAQFLVPEPISSSIVMETGPGVALAGATKDGKHCDGLQ